MEFQEKIVENFAGMVVRKDLSKLVKGNSVVPNYVLEYLLGQHCATSDSEIIIQGVEKVKEIIKRNYVHSDEAEVIKSTIKEKGEYKIIDKISVKLNDKRNAYEASFSNLGLKNILIGSPVVTNNKKLLTSGVWCILKISYNFTDDINSSPWNIEDIRPIQISGIDLDEYKKLRQNFSKDEWIDLMLQSVGLNPEFLNSRSKLINLARLIPFCENNYNLIELGPKGTGKSHIYSELSPHGVVISGSEITPAKLFVNNTSNQIGLVGYWDNIAFDEFAGQDKKSDRVLIDIMKGYLAQKTFSRGKDPQGAFASFTFIGNTAHSVSYMMKHTNLFEALPKGYLDSALLDRLHCYLPGWEVSKLRNELFTDDYGFIVDYLAEILKGFRKEDYSNLIQKYFKINTNLTERELTGVKKTFSGLVKIIFPDGNFTKEEGQELLNFALEGRKRVSNQLSRIDETFKDTCFSYVDIESEEEIEIITLEEKQYPTFSNQVIFSSGENATSISEEREIVNEPNLSNKNKDLFSGEHIKYEENQKGISYEKILIAHLIGAKIITIYDPYIRLFYQIKNLMEFLQMILKIRPEGEDIKVKLITQYDEFRPNESEEKLEQLKDSIDGSGIAFEFEFDQSKDFHARSVETDTGWKITLDRGLDIFQPYDFKNPFNLANNLQEERLCKRFEVTYLKV